ncbi:ABC transporter permease subunit [Alphaproteobacteria bacterium]|nr:ABC transporter permease subunit [Alphaproteobacteria bacterium]
MHQNSATDFSLRRLFYNQEVRSVGIQIITLAVICYLVFSIGQNVIVNLAAIGKDLSLNFLWAPAGYDITFQPFVDYGPTDTHFHAAMVGLSNTLLVAVTGIILATILGFTLGVMRLSNNFLVSKLSQIFIDFTRNVPVLLHIFFIYGVIINLLPVPKKAEAVSGVFFFTNRGIFAPAPTLEQGYEFVVGAFFIAIAACFVLAKWAKNRQIATGQIFPVFWSSVAMIIALPLITNFIVGGAIGVEVPKLKGFNFKGGLSLRPEYVALWFALSYYTASFIAEIVRGGILAIHKGQKEAAHALGISPNRTLRLVIIPQALPLIIPPIASNYLNLTKNSSLAIAIGYFDIVATLGGISLMQTGKEVETMSLVLLTYLCLSLIISAGMNYLNHRVALKAR